MLPSSERGRARRAAAPLRHAARSTIAIAITLGLSASCSPETENEAAPIAGFRGGPRHLGVYAATDGSGHGVVEWSFQTGGAIRSSPLVVEDVALFGNGDGVFYAVNATDGSERWRFQAEGPISSSPAVAGGLVFFGDRANRFYALERRSGRLRWRVETGIDREFDWGLEGWDYFTSSPTPAGGLVIVGSGDGNVYAFEAESGEERWRFQTGGRVRSSPAVADGRAYVGSADGVLYAIEVETGQAVWRFESEGAGLRSAEWGFDRKTIQSSPAVSDGTVYFGSRDGGAYAVDAASGELRWRHDNGMPWVISSPAVEGSQVYFGSSDGLFVHALDASTGAEVWQLPTGSRVFSSPAVSGDWLYLGHHGGQVLAVARESGELAWELELGAAVMSSPVIHDGRVYIGADDGKLYAIRMADAPAPRLAVYWDQERVDWNTLASHEQVRDYLSRRGYEVLDSDELAEFMRAGIDGGGRSVVVFAMDDLPRTVAAQAADTVLARRYLEAGGKIVWLGLPPLLLMRDETGRVTGVDRSRPGALLGVSHASYNVDRYPAYPTEAGRAWGLTGWWIAGTGVDTSEVSATLAIGETGHAAAWSKSFSDTPGSGYVHLWGSFRPIELSYFPQIRAVAEAGLTRALPVAGLGRASR